MEVFSVVLEIEKENLLVIVYRIPVPLGTFIDDIILLISELPTQQRIWIVGDFNLDQILSQNVAKVDPLIQNFNLSQRSQYSTRVHGRLLDILLDTSNFKLFLLYHHPSMITLLFFSKSDHYNYTGFSFQQFSFQSSLHNLC